jgi:4-hydroxy-tetrahydrodipicolinate synthase
MDQQKEHRRQRRNRTLKSGRIIFNGGYSVLTCTIRNLSEGGAMIEVVAMLGIPHEFDLAVEPAPPRRCRVAWRRDNRLGVYFVTAENAALDRPEETGPVSEPAPVPAELRAPELPSAPASPGKPETTEAPKPAARSKRPLTGVWPPVTTPFRDDGAVDNSRLAKHCRRLLDDGAHGLAVLGTTSEANSLTLAERHGVIEGLLKAGIDADKLLPGVGACAVDDAASLTRYAGEIGAAAVLLLPPFFYKKVNDEGLYTFVSRIIDKAGSYTPRILLYHIPPIAVVGWSLELIGRLISAFPGIVVGMKDSSGDFEHTKRVIEAFPGFVVFPGAETNLVSAMQAGGAGCISATANINARGIRAVFDRWMESDAARHQSAANAVRMAIEKRVMISALKAVLAVRYGDSVWNNVRAPLLALTPGERAELFHDPAIAQLLEPEKTTV